MPAVAARGERQASSSLALFGSLAAGSGRTAQGELP